jgi:predicted MFS family arabinose efflux permease
MVALAVAMGIGRFAFTPLLPMMLSDGVVDLATASWLASANYLGYLAGALLCTFQPWIWRRLGWQASPQPALLVRTGLAATVVLTIGMAAPWAPTWPALRFAAGVASALVFVYTSGWCLGQLANLGVPHLGAMIYTGPGAGILVSGLAASAMVALGWRAAAGWAIFGLLAFLLSLVVWRVFHSPASVAPTSGAPGTAPSTQVSQTGAEVTMLSLAYGLAGFGYIITATFLPVIARAALPDSAWLDLFWPLFGAGVIVGALVASRVPSHGDRRWLLAACYAMQCLGVLASLVWATEAGFAIGSLLLGLPFTAITFFAMQEVRRLRATQAASTMGLLTAMYGLGQIAGPPLTAAMVARSSSAAAGFTLALEIAAGSLAAGATMYAVMTRLFPLSTRA